MMVNAATAAALLAGLLILIVVVDGSNSSSPSNSFAYASGIALVVAAAFLLMPALRQVWAMGCLGLRSTVHLGEDGKAGTVGPTDDGDDKEDHSRPVQAPSSTMWQQRRMYLVPTGWMQITLAACNVLLLGVLPIVVFSVVLFATNIWYMTLIVISASAYSLFVCVMDLSSILEWTGPAGMTKLGQHSWLSGRTAYLFFSRMQQKRTLQVMAIFMAFIAFFVVVLAIGGLNETPSTYQVHAIPLAPRAPGSGMQA